MFLLSVPTVIAIYLSFKTDRLMLVLGFYFSFFISLLYSFIILIVDLILHQKKNYHYLYYLPTALLITSLAIIFYSDQDNLAIALPIVICFASSNYLSWRRIKKQISNAGARIK